MSDIFLSYKDIDRPRAELLSGELTAAGWDVWWDRSILPGETFDDVIEAALAAASCVVVLWTTDSVGSSWVRTEAAEGRDRNILIPVMLDDVDIPIAFRRVQAADLTDWRPGEQHAEFDELLIAITNLAGQPEPVVTPLDHDEQTDLTRDLSEAGGGSGANEHRPSTNRAPVDRTGHNDPPPSRSRKWLPAAIGVATVLLLTVIVMWFALRPPSDPSSTAATETTHAPATATATGATTTTTTTTTTVGSRSMAYDEMVLASGPIVYWPLANDSTMVLRDLMGTHDLVPRDIDGAPFVPTYVAGPAGIGGIDFINSPNSRLESTFNPNVELGTCSWTLELWINLE